MDIAVCLIATISLLLIREVSTQQVDVRLWLSRERTEEGDAVVINCEVTGDGFMVTDSVIIRKINDTSSDIVASNGGPLGSWNPRSNIQGGTLTLLIHEASRSDSGEYACTVLRQPGSTTLAEQKINLDVLYLPDNPGFYPLCATAPSELTYLEGDVVTLTCSSLLGNPIPQLNWSRSDGVGIPTAEVTIHLDTITSEINIALALDDDGVKFTCNVRSEAYPEYQDSCSSTSIYVIPRPTTNMPTTSTIVTTKSATTTHLPTTMATTLSATTMATTFFATTKTESTSKTVTQPNTRTSRFTTSTKPDLTTRLKTQTKNTDTTSKSVATTSNVNGTAAASNDALKIGVIAGSIVGVVLLAITIVSLYFVIRSDRCCGEKSKNSLPPSSAYAHEVSLDEVQDSYVGIGNEGTTAHVRAPNSNQLYAVVNRNRNSIGGGTQRSASIRDDYSDPPPYPGPPDGGSHDAPLYGSTRTEDAISSSRPSIDEVAQRHLYDMTPSDHEEEEEEEASIDSAKASNDKPSYYADLDLSEFGGTLRPNRPSANNDSGPYSSIQLSRV